MLLPKLIPFLFSFLMAFAPNAQANESSEMPLVELVCDEDDDAYMEHDNTSMISTTYQKTFGKMMLTLFGLIALVFGGLWLLRRLTQNRYSQLNDTRLIKVIERRPISPKTILYLLDVNGKTILISESQFEVSLLSQTEDKPQIKT